MSLTKENEYFWRGGDEDEGDDEADDEEGEEAQEEEKGTGMRRAGMAKRQDQE